jgi:hypothetical protein
MAAAVSWSHPIRRRRALLAGLLVFQAAWIGWGLASVLHRAHDAAVAAPDPRRWRFWTPEVADLRTLLGEVVPTLPPDAAVRVDEGTAPADPAEVWHWCQYLAPKTAFVRGVDGVDAGRARFRLRWNLAASDRDWRPVAARGAFAFEARRTGPAP